MRAKTIIILSPQNWGTMFLSKHHYAVELAKLGNKVYFINPPKDFRFNIKTIINIEPEGSVENLFIVEHRLNFPYLLKFKAIEIFHYLIKFHINKLVKKIGVIDIVWSFDLGNIYPFKYFHSVPKKIFFPVDEPLNKAAIESAKGANIVVSITKEILDKYLHFNISQLQINHGVADYFLQKENEFNKTDDKIRIGLSGNFMRKDIDRPILLKIINENPNILFECFGAYETTQSNISGDNYDKETNSFVELIKNANNVILHGPVPPKKLAKELHRMDAFLICYDVQKDQSKGTNYHKVMEYLAIGKVIISNNISTYINQPDFVQMVKERENNEELPKLLNKIVSNISEYNSILQLKKRIEFAKSNTYQLLIKNHESILLSNKE